MTVRTTAPATALLMLLTSTVLAGALAIQAGVPTADARGNDHHNEQRHEDKHEDKHEEKKEKKEMRKEQKEDRKEERNERRDWRKEWAKKIRDARRNRHHRHHRHHHHTGSGSTASGSTASGSTASGTLIDIAVTKDDGKLTIQPGQSNTYTITVTNYGPSAASPAYIMDQLPAAYDPATVTLSCAKCSFVAGAGTSNIYAEAHLLAGQSAVLTVTATVKSTVAPGTVIINTAFAGSALDANDTNKNNNGYDDATLVVAVV